MSEAAFYLKKGGVAPAPAPGDKAIILDTDNAIKTVDSGGNKTAIGGAVTASYPLAVAAGNITAPGIPINWYAGALAFAQSKLATLVNPVWSAEMLPAPSSAEIEIATATNTGTATLSTTAAGGAIDFTSGATANSLRIARNKNGTIAEGNFLTPNMKTGIWAVCTRAKIVTMNATADLVLCGISDETVLSVWLGTHGATSTTNLVLSTNSVTDLGVALPALNTYVDLMMIGDGTNITCYLGDGTGNNWAQIGAPQSQAGLPTNAGHWIGYAGNNATASNCACSIDKALFITTNAA